MQSLDARGLVCAWLRMVASSAGRRLLALVFLVDACFAFLFFIALQSYFSQDRVLGLRATGLTLGAFGVAKLLSQYIAGRASDSLGPRPATSGALVLIMFSLGLIVVSQRAGILLVPAAGLYGVASALIWPAIYSNASRLPDDQRSTVAAAITVTTGLAVGSALGLGFLLPEDLPFGIAASICGLAAVCALVLALGTRTVASEAEAVKPAGVAPEPMSTGNLVALSLVFFLQSSAVAALLALFRPIGRDVLGVGLHEELLMLGPAAVAFGAGVVCAGVLGVSLSRGALLPMALILAASGFLALGLVDGLTMGLVSLALACFGLGMAVPTTVSTALSAALGTPGAVFGVLLTLEGLGHSFGPIAVGVSPNTDVALCVVAALLTAGAVCAMLTASFEERAGSESLSEVCVTLADSA